MANICDYDIKMVSNDKETLEKAMSRLLEFPSAQYDGGAVHTEIKQEGTELFSVGIAGCCRWSATSSHLLSDLESVCKVFKIDAEIVTEEAGCQFSEHVVYRYDEEEGEVVEDLNETYDFEEFYLDDLLEDKEEFESSTGIHVSENQWRAITSDPNVLASERYGFTDNEGGTDIANSDYIHRGTGIAEADRWY